jgi:uncharacterized protein
LAQYIYNEMNSRRLFANTSLLQLALVILLAASAEVFSQDAANKPFSINESPLPAPTSPVTDNAGVLDAATKQNLEKRLIEFRDRTNPKVELAVVVVNTTGDRPIFDYSLAVARGWGIGSKEDDSPSALLFVAIQDRKYFTHVSRNLEDELPDGVVGQTQREYLVPAFRRQEYGKGITDTMEAFIRAIEAKQSGEGLPPTAEATPAAKRTRKATRSSFGVGGVCCLVIAFVVILLIFSRSSRGGGGRGGGWRGGGFGGGGGSVLPWVVGSVIANSLGNSSSGGWSSGGGSSDWGGGGGGGDSWGGFGGGGDFGGGGAGGDW